MSRRVVLPLLFVAAAIAYLAALVFYPGLNPVYAIAWARNAALSVALTDTHHVVDLYRQEKGTPPSSLDEAIAFLRESRPNDERLTRIESVEGHLFYKRLNDGYVLFCVGWFPKVGNNAAAYLNDDFYRSLEALLTHRYLLIDRRAADSLPSSQVPLR
jgi:hypothetical protein